jgi:predicted transcriptional regulator
MKNITVTLDDETAKWLRIKAAEQNQSMSRFLGDLLQQQMKDRIAYQRAMESWLAKAPYVLREAGEHLPTRDEIYDRSRSR